jgi:hypothetical protein
MISGPKDLYPLAPLRLVFAMTTMLAMTAVLIGAMLGLRFKVLILVPANVIGSAATLGLGIAHSNSFWSTLLAIALAITALQIGYLGGTAIRFLIAAARVRKDLPRAMAIAQRPVR